MEKKEILNVLELASCELHYCYKRLEIKKSNVDDLVQLTSDKIESQKWVFANFYKDEQGIFLSDSFYETKQKAYDNRDVLKTYFGTFLIIM